MRKNRLLSLFLPLLLAFSLLFTGCNLNDLFGDLTTLPLGGSSESSGSSESEEGSSSNSKSESESWPAEEGVFCTWKGIEIPAFSGGRNAKVPDTMEDVRSYSS